MYLPRVLLLAGCLGLIGSHAFAEDDFTASFRLRGGFDSNPQFSSGQGSGSAFVAADTALAAGMKADGYTLGVAAEADTVQYSQPLLTPSRGGKVILRGSIGDEDLKLDSTSTIADTSTYNLRSTDLIQSVRAEARYGAIKVFGTAEGGRSSLNQTNAIFQDFLPDPQQYLRGTLIPGVSLVSGKSELGASVNLSVRHYLQEFDVFGYRRSNERVQPFLFAKYRGDAVTAFVSVSRLYGKWHDPDFTNVDRTLFNASLTWGAAPFRIDLTAWRRAGETTFPISPITIETAYSAKVSWTAEPKVTLAASVGYAASDYLDSPFHARTLTCGVGASRDIKDDLTLGIEVAYAKGSLISGDDVNGLVITSSITKRFSSTPPEPKKRAGV
jgi:hypothetical protein